MSSIVITLIGTKNNRLKRVELPMPEGFTWDAETAHVVDFMSKGEVFLVAGLQINAVNPSTGDRDR